MTQPHNSNKAWENGYLALLPLRGQIDKAELVGSSPRLSQAAIFVRESFFISLNLL